MTGAGMLDPDSGLPALADDARLESSSVVANCAMNRGRGLAGVNSYTRELGVNPLEVLKARRRDATGTDTPGGWLDLCCGSGRAMIQAARQLSQSGASRRISLVGVDLVDAFDPCPELPGLELVSGSVVAWSPGGRRFDLVTCVHGLHYVGDKLAVLTRAASWLTNDGMFIADLDLSSIRLRDGRPAGRRLAAALRAAGFSYDARRRRISLRGGRDLELPYVYLGADDRVGPNYTGQPAVHSYYAESH